MSPELESFFHSFVGRAVEALSVDPYTNPREAEAEIRTRFLEQWQQFSQFGVESRVQLEPIVVQIRRKATKSQSGEVSEQVDISVKVDGTPLETRRGVN